MGGQSKSLSIRARVLLLVAVLALPFVAVQLWVGFRELRHIQAGAEASVLAEASEVAASLTQFVAIGQLPFHHPDDPPRAAPIRQPRRVRRTGGCGLRLR